MLRRLVLSLLVAVLALGGAARARRRRRERRPLPARGCLGRRVRRDPPVPCGARVADQRLRAGRRHADPAPDAVHGVRAGGRADPHGVVVDRHGQRGHRDLEPGRGHRHRGGTLPTLVDGTNGFSCAAHRPDAASLVGKLSTRDPGAGPRAVRGRDAEHRRLRALRLHGADRPACTAWPSTARRAPATRPTARRTGTSTRRAGFPAAAGSSVNAWDLTVRAGTDNASVDGHPGPRLHLRARGLHGRQPAAGHHEAVTSTRSTATATRVDTHGFDPNGFVFYGNREGFLDADGTTPLNHDVVGTGTAPQTLPSLVGGVHLAPPQYPLSFEPLAAETLAALGIPATPVPPTLSAVDFSGRATDHGSYVGQGGTFRARRGLRRHVRDRHLARRRQLRRRPARQPRAARRGRPRARSR